MYWGMARFWNHISIVGWLYHVISPMKCHHVNDINHDINDIPILVGVTPSFLDTHSNDGGVHGLMVGFQVTIGDMSHKISNFFPSLLGMPGMPPMIAN